MEIRLEDSDNSEIKELKSKCRRQFSHFLLFVTLGIIWLLSTAAGYLSHHLSILLFICTLAMTKPLLAFIGKILKTSKSNKLNTLKLTTKIIGLGVVFGLSAVFFPFVNNINLFFPAFGIVTSLIFLAIFIALRLKIHLFAAAILMAEGIYTAYTFPNDFMVAGYIEGYTLLGIGLSCGLIGKLNRYRLFLNKKKRKNRTRRKLLTNAKASNDKTIINEEI